MNVEKLTDAVMKILEPIFEDLQTLNVLVATLYKKSGMSVEDFNNLKQTIRETLKEGK